MYEQPASARLASLMFTPVMASPLAMLQPVRLSKAYLAFVSQSWGFVIAVDMADENAIVSPGGVGFDIGCGVRLIRTNLRYKVLAVRTWSPARLNICRQDVKDIQEQLAQSLFDHIPVGVGSKGIIPTKASDLEEALVRAGYCVSGLAAQRNTGNGNGLESTRRICLA